MVDEPRQHRPRPRAGEHQPHQAHPEALDPHVAARQVRLEPAQVVELGGRRAPDEEIVGAALRHGEVADQLAGLVQHRRERDPPGARHPVGEQPLEPGLGAVASHRELGEVGDLGDADAFANGANLVAHRVEIVGAMERQDVAMLLSLGGVPEWHLHAPGHAHHRAVLGDLDVVERRRLLRAGRRQLLVREADREAARVVLAHLGVGVARRRPLAEPRHVHAEDVVAGVALRHPVGDDEADAAALAEARHHRAGDPEVRQPRHRPDQAGCRRGRR